MKPYLRDFVPNAFEDIPDATAYEAGYLVTKNAGWRNVRPVIDAQKWQSTTIFARAAVSAAKSVK